MHLLCHGQSFTLGDFTQTPVGSKGRSGRFASEILPSVLTEVLPVKCKKGLLLYLDLPNVCQLAEIGKGRSHVGHWKIQVWTKIPYKARYCVQLQGRPREGSNRSRTSHLAPWAASCSWGLPDIPDLMDSSYKQLESLQKLLRTGKDNPGSGIEQED